jgi:hypothetical protein
LSKSLILNDFVIFINQILTRTRSHVAHRGP